MGANRDRTAEIVAVLSMCGLVATPDRVEKLRPRAEEHASVVGPLCGDTSVIGRREVVSCIPPGPVVDVGANVAIVSRVRLLDLRLCAVLGQEAANAWLCSEHPDLLGFSPVEALRMGDLSAVEAVVGVVVGDQT